MNQETESVTNSNRASYSPEDNKLRLYVGRVPRDEYEKLRAEGWTSTPKQSCDFVATWTPTRRDTALEYADIIEDEDQGPEDRAADRAERFGEYRDKRTSEAVGQADRYDAGPQAHGYQNAARAERSARRHDRIASHACDSWSKAEYWQRRTAGVISHALYKSRPDVRMGRIKTLEAELRRFEANPEHYPEWLTHTRLRLAYENQMLEAQGGRAAHVEMIPGGFIGGRQIHKVNKSAVTGRVVSVSLKVPAVTGWNYRTTNVPGTDYALMQMDTERLAADAYRAPTDDELAAFNTAKKEIKAAAPVKAVCPLINPTDADAERLQAIWNAASREPSTVAKMTQAVYSARSQGAYSCFKTVTVSELGTERRDRVSMRERERCSIFKVRTAPSSGFNTADRVLIITDKPQKAIPFDVMEAERAKQPSIESMTPRLPEIKAALCEAWLTDENKPLLRDAEYVGWVNIQSMSQFYWTEAGREAFEKFTPKPTVATQPELINA